MRDETMMILINMSVCKARNKFRSVYGISEKLRPDVVCVDFMDDFYTEHKKDMEASGHTFTISLVRGCIASNSKVPSKYWGIPHVWCLVKVDGNKRFYVDPTSEIFKGSIPYVSWYYISTMAPWWLKAYSRNPMKIRKLHAWFNRSPFRGLSIITHNIHAKTSDVINNIFYQKKK